MADFDLSVLAPMAGVWEFRSDRATYVRPQEGKSKYGLTLLPSRLRSGILRATVTLEEGVPPEKDQAARIAFGYNAESGAYFSAGIGGYSRAYVLDEFVPGAGWRAVELRGVPKT